MAVYTLENTIMEYDWGDPDWIPELLGVPNPEGTPKAELWMGAHPSAPSRVVELDGKPLDEVIRSAPAEYLGSVAARRHEDRLPFLFKVLAAGKPLSIQAHPNKKQAEDGFGRENEAGIPLSAPHRNYKDSNHKPEIICSLTPFWALRGFRPPEELWNLLSPVAEGTVAEALGALKASKDANGIRGFFEGYLSADPDSLHDSVTATVGCIVRDGSAAGIPEAEIRWVRDLSAAYPGDPGVLCPLILNLINLEPGQAMYLPAGELHAYLQGLGMELMANSDNVLRGGLTAKHVDVPELLRTLHFEGRKPEILTPEEQASVEAAHEAVYAVPTDEFALSRITLSDGSTYRSPLERSLEILLCYEGTCYFATEDGSNQDERGGWKVSRGRCVLLPASAGQYRITGSGTLYKAAVP